MNTGDKSKKVAETRAEIVNLNEQESLHVIENENALKRLIVAKERSPDQMEESQEAEKRTDLKRESGIDPSHQLRIEKGMTENRKRTKGNILLMTAKMNQVEIRTLMLLNVSDWE